MSVSSVSGRLVASVVGDRRWDGGARRHAAERVDAVALGTHGDPTGDFEEQAPERDLVASGIDYPTNPARFGRRGGTDTAGGSRVCTWWLLAASTVRWL